MLEELHITQIRDQKGKTPPEGGAGGGNARALATFARVHLLDEPFTGSGPHRLSRYPTDNHDLKNKEHRHPHYGPQSTGDPKITERAYIMADGRLWPPATPTISPTIRMPKILLARATERRSMKLVDRLIMRELFGPIVNSIFMFLIVLFAAAFLQADRTCW